MDATDYQEELNFQKYWLVLKRRWLPATGVFAVVLALGTLYAFTRKPSYQADAKLLFQSNRSAALTGVLSGPQGNDAGNLGRLEALDNRNNPLDTQAEIIRSRPVAQATIDALQLRDSKGKPVEPEDLLKRLVVKPVPGTDILTISYKTDSPREAAAIVNKVISVFIQKNIQNNRAEPIAAREFIANQLPITEAAVRQADQALREFKERNQVLVLSEEATASVKMMATLDEQIIQTRSLLNDAIAQAGELQTQIRTDPKQLVLYTRLSQAPGVQNVLTQLQQAQQELAVQQTRYLTGPVIDQLELKVATLDNLLKDRIQQITETERSIPPGGLQMGKEDALAPKVANKLIETEAQKLGLANRLNTLLAAQTAYKQRAGVMPKLEQIQRELERRLEASQKTYETLLSRLQEIQVTENQNIGNARIVAAAQVPKKPAPANKKLMLAGSALAGLLLAIATAFALDLMDRSVKTLKEARDLFGYTLLGVIPTFHSRSGRNLLVGSLAQPVSPVVLREAPQSGINDAFQMLQANLKFLSSDSPIKTIVVTSSVAGEGKSFIAANLAATAAQIGQRVLLVDADLRCPTQHHIWESVSTKGLSNVIVEQFPTDEAVQEVMPNLFLLSAGVIPPNPIALLGSNRMKSLVDEFSTHYDLVIFDAPPVAGKADAAVLGKIVDGVLLITRPGVTDFTSANATKELLSNSGQNVLGMVVNGIDVKNEPDSYFYYTKDERNRKELSENITTIEMP